MGSRSEDQSFESLTVYADQNDYAVFDVFKDNVETSVLCHYQIDNDSSHCNLVENGYEQTGNFELIVSVSDQDISVLLQESGITMDVVSDPVWPWVLGAVVTYYTAKKAINYWVHKTFTPKPHVHAQFFIPKDDLEDRNIDLMTESQDRFEKLNQITTSLSHPSELLFKGAVVNALLEEKILALTKGLLTDVTQYCSVCKTTHSEFDTHFDFKSSLTSFNTPVTSNFDFNIQSSSESKSQFQVLVESATTQHESCF